MIFEFEIAGKTAEVDLSHPIPISIPMQSGENNPRAWYLDHQPPEFLPVTHGDWTGSVAKGASVNFNTLCFNPHAHGTHTECVGHIDKDCTPLSSCLTTYFFKTLLISISPIKRDADWVLAKRLFKKHKKAIKAADALVIRTLPNTQIKKLKNYSHSNWPYLTAKAAQFLNTLGVQHLLIDLPSVDKEKDDGFLQAHKAFWGYPDAIRKKATITEFVYVPDAVKDGVYLLNLMVTDIRNDASPSKPCLYPFRFKKKL